MWGNHSHLNVRCDIDFKRISFVCAQRGSQNKIENVWFCSGGFSYAIQETFTAWQVNSTLNLIWKSDIALIAIVEFTCQAVNFSIVLAVLLTLTSLFMLENFLFHRSNYSYITITRHYVLSPLSVLHWEEKIELH